MTCHTDRGPLCGGDPTLTAYVQNGRRVSFAEVTSEDLRGDVRRLPIDPDRARLAQAELVRRFALFTRAFCAPRGAR